MFVQKEFRTFQCRSATFEAKCLNMLCKIVLRHICHIFCPLYKIFFYSEYSNENEQNFENYAPIP